MSIESMPSTRYQGLKLQGPRCKGKSPALPHRVLACWTSGNDGQCGSQTCQAGALRSARPGKRSRDERRRARVRDWWIARGQSPAVVRETLGSAAVTARIAPTSTYSLLSSRRRQRPTTAHDTPTLVRHPAAAHCPPLPPRETASTRLSEPVRRRNRTAYGCPPSHRLSDCAASAALPWCCWAHGLAERQLHPDCCQRALLSPSPAAPTHRGARHGALEHVLVPATRPRKARRLERGLARTRPQPCRLSAALAVAEHRVLCVATLRRQPQLPLELAHIALSAAAAAHHPRRIQAGPGASRTTRACS
jgi:hypothetical protein